VGELAVRLEATRTVTYDAAAQVAARRGRAETNVAIHRAKYMVSELGPWLTSQAIRICGGSSIARRLPLERLYRDARCGGLMPARSDDCLSYVGKQALGIDTTDPADSYW
jgi:alkylation response protein AidB-like acyl-CoA dehydrogenase